MGEFLTKYRINKSIYVEIFRSNDALCYYRVNKVTFLVFLIVAAVVCG
jgi:hypothetical protein